MTARGDGAAGRRDGVDPALAGATRRGRPSDWPWDLPKDKGGYSLITLKGITYRAEGTGWSFDQLVKKVKNGEAETLSVGTTEETDG